MGTGGAERPAPGMRPVNELGAGTTERMPKSWSLKALLVAIGLILTLPPLILEAVLLYRYSVAERSRAELDLQEDAKGAGNLIDAKFVAAEHVLRVLAASPLLVAGDLKGFEALLRRVSRETDRPYVLVAPDGTQVINTNAPEGAALPRSNTAHWSPALAKRRAYATNVFKGALSGDAVMSVVVPIIQQDTVRWTLNVSLYSKDFADVLAAPGVPGDWIVSVVDREGVHLARSHGNAQFAGRPMVPALVAHLKEQKSGVLQTTTLEGIRVISTTARAPRSDWAVAIGRPAAELNAPLERQFAFLFAAGLAIVAAGLAIAWLLSRQINQAIGHISRQAHRLASGEPIEKGRSLLKEGTIIDEALIRSAMVLAQRDSAMRELTASLERQVAARTAELEQTNLQLRAEIARRAESEQNFSVLVQGVADYSLILLSPEGLVTTWNLGAERMKGYLAHEIQGAHFSRFYTEEDRARGIPARALETAAREGKFEVEGLRVRKSGERFWAHTVIDAIRDEAGTLVGYAKITRDITQRKQAEQELNRAQQDLAHAQKIEATGQLTGGIAHDFNNMLAVILASARLLQDRLRRGEDVQPFIDGIREAAERGVALTKGLLAFARRQPLAPEPIDSNRLVKDMSEIFRRTIPESIEIETVLAGGLWTTRADRNALENALLNLVTNARDAMAAGGRLTIETANAYLDDAYAARHAEIAPGQYVVVAVTDTGAGMTPDVMQRAFEPFFTTKPTGQGTGLGLSQVYGFAKQSDGHAKIYSEPGRGTTIKLYLPRLLSAEKPSDKERDISATLLRSLQNEQILVVEDDPQVRKLVLEMLAELGYRTTAATSPADALTLLEKCDVALMLTDVVMPGMNGRQLAEKAQSVRPGLKTLFMTGYTQNAIVHNGILDPGVALLTKPFSLEELGRKLREMLAGK